MWLGPTARLSDSVGLGWGLSVGISNKPHSAAAAGSGTHFEKHSNLSAASESTHPPSDESLSSHASQQLQVLSTVSAIQLPFPTAHPCSDPILFLPATGSISSLKPPL